MAPGAASAAPGFFVPPGGETRFMDCGGNGASNVQLEGLSLSSASFAFAFAFLRERGLRRLRRRRVGLRRACASPLLSLTCEGARPVQPAVQRRRRFASTGGGRRRCRARHRQVASARDAARRLACHRIVSPRCSRGRPEAEPTENARLERARERCVLLLALAPPNAHLRTRALHRSPTAARRGALVVRASAQISRMAQLHIEVTLLESDRLRWTSMGPAASPLRSRCSALNSPTSSGEGLDTLSVTGPALREQARVFAAQAHARFKKHPRRNEVESLSVQSTGGGYALFCAARPLGMRGDARMIEVDHRRASCARSSSPLGGISPGRPARSHRAAHPDRERSSRQRSSASCTVGPNANYAIASCVRTQRRSRLLRRSRRGSTETTLRPPESAADSWIPLP